MHRLLGALALFVVAGEKPAPVSKALAEYLGEYGKSTGRVIVLEANGQLLDIDGSGAPVTLKPAGKDQFVADGKQWKFSRNGAGKIIEIKPPAAGSLEKRTDFPEDGSIFRIKMTHPIGPLRTQALEHHPPAEKVPVRKTDLVELSKLDSSIHLDIRYATTNNFMGNPMYTQARAFLQRQAAEALLKASKNLLGQGFGLLIHDAYRPWYVTWMFWEATSPQERTFVANPAEGSKHNRGCAVDLSMYELATGKPVSMPSVYDEMTDRAYAEYPGGTSLQRWYRAVLREAMEKQGFNVIRTEWWHFDYKDWKDYAIGNVRFEDLKQ